ncbi:prolyl-tRNA synthetase associated domain-containing protein [Treponema sp.]|uniref:prolyl-tRNA synthetase associated domain-containing protein n=1 Tax=Treponema sp. TaxID=166 RepID=UPI003EFC3EA4
MEEILQVLNELNIPFEIQEHKAIFSEKDCNDVVVSLEGIEVKNLFLKDKNQNYALVSMALHKKADLKKIAAAFGYGRLSFCNSDELMKYLNITPGSVTPLCIMFDRERAVNVLFDENFEGKKVIVHPLRNTASVSISFDDLKRFTEHFSHKYLVADVYKDED